MRTSVELIASADVFLSSLRQQALVKLGLSYEALRADHPRLVYGLLTGYGTKGPDIDRPAFDARQAPCRCSVREPRARLRSRAVYDPGTARR